MKYRYSVVVTVKNEEKRILDCLTSIFQDEPDEVIVVDGDSSDRTVEIARQFPGIKVIVSKNSSLTRDRQVGIDAARNLYVAMIDGDQRVLPGDINSLITEMEEQKFDVIQSSLMCAQKSGFWDAAEEALWDLVHNLPGQKSTVGGAPTIYKKNVFEFVRFDERITRTTEDTDFFYRLSKFPHLRIGVGRTKIRQYHFATFQAFLKKYLWYGKGDGEFCQKHPERAPSMIFHLLVRYPILYSLRALRQGNFYAIPICILQGTVRFTGVAKYFLSLCFSKSRPA
jgi:glycosyltransferase involved in cell wall biosynthesis